MVKEKSQKFQGAVPEGFSIRRFRETGKTSKIVKGKEVLAKDLINKKKESKRKKSNKVIKSLQKAAKTKAVSRKILKGEQMEVRIPERQTESVLGDTNRFFKQEMEETKRSIFS